MWGLKKDLNLNLNKYELSHEGIDDNLGKPKLNGIELNIASQKWYGYRCPGRDSNLEPRHSILYLNLRYHCLRPLVHHGWMIVA